MLFIIVTDSIQKMDVEVKPPLIENGTNAEEGIKSQSTDENTEESTVESTKPVIRQKQKRSRSKTPNKIEESKCLQVNLTKLEEEASDGLKETEEQKPEATNGETENGTKEDEPITKRTKLQKESITQEVIEVSKEDKEKTPQKTSSPKKGDSAKKNISKNGDSAKKDTSKNEAESDSIEMEPLVLSDEHEPELQFDEFSDKESGKGSPIIPRCVTRRSLTRNIPTPKTPKSIDQDMESEKTSTTTDQTETDESQKHEEEDTNESTYSTKVEVGSDETRLEYTDKNITLPVDDTYLSEYREKSLSETIRCLSARKPIRDVYRNRTSRTQEKSGLDAPFCSRNYGELNSTGVKRKNRSITPEETKKFKSDTSFFSSPLANLRGKFRSDPVTSSTPLLRGYKDDNTELHFDGVQGHSLENGLDDKKSWCSLM